MQRGRFRDRYSLADAEGDGRHALVRALTLRIDSQRFPPGRGASAPAPVVLELREWKGVCMTNRMRELLGRYSAELSALTTEGSSAEPGHARASHRRKGGGDACTVPYGGGAARCKR